MIYNANRSFLFLFWLSCRKEEFKNNLFIHKTGKLNDRSNQVMPRAQVTATTDRREKLIDGFLSSNHRMPIWFDSQNCDSNQVRKGSLWLPSSKLLVFPKIKKKTYTVFAILIYCWLLLKSFLAQCRSIHCIGQIINQTQSSRTENDSDLVVLCFDVLLQWKFFQL